MANSVKNVKPLFVLKNSMLFSKFVYVQIHSESIEEFLILKNRKQTAEAAHSILYYLMSCRPLHNVKRKNA